ncbi:MAG: hypothetical protein IT578_03885 [Verrucomicrobiae bacterium]|nr:hypothetical protein [Verrucomicrobiae bacterium]
MKKIALILGLAFSLAATQSMFADDGSGVVSAKKASVCKTCVCKACGKKPCCCDKSGGKGWNYKKFQKH